MGAAEQQEHGLSDEQMPAELVEREQLLNDARAAIMNGRFDLAKRKMDEQELCAERARVRLRERERFA